MAEIAESVGLLTFALPCAARTCHAWLTRLTRARRGGSEGGRRESSLLTFAALFVSKKRDKHKEFLVSLQKTPHTSRFARHLLPQEKAFHPLFLLTKQAQKKKL